MYAGIADMRVNPLLHAIGLIQDLHNVTASDNRVMRDCVHGDHLAVYLGNEPKLVAQLMELLDLSDDVLQSTRQWGNLLAPSTADST